MKIINILETSYCSYCKRDDILYLIEYVERYYNERPGAIILGINQQNMMTSNIIPAGALRVYSDSSYRNSYYNAYGERRQLPAYTPPRATNNGAMIERGVPNNLLGEDANVDGIPLIGVEAHDRFDILLYGKTLLPEGVRPTVEINIELGRNRKIRA